MRYLDELIYRYPKLEIVSSKIEESFSILEDCFQNGGKLLIAGNGGSAADSEHIAGELMKGFIKERKPEEDFRQKLQNINSKHAEILGDKLQMGLPTISLTGHLALTSACINDISGDLVFAQQVYGYGKKGDVFLAISTSGNSKNVCYAITVAKALGMKVIALTGNNGGKMRASVDVCIAVAETECYKVQELHLPIYHTLCLMLEERFF